VTHSTPQGPEDPSDRVIAVGIREFQIRWGRRLGGCSGLVEGWSISSLRFQFGSARRGHPVNLTPSVIKSDTQRNLHALLCGGCWWAVLLGAESGAEAFFGSAGAAGAPPSWSAGQTGTGGMHEVLDPKLFSRNILRYHVHFVKKNTNCPPQPVDPFPTLG
jgi:hypothetical protein